MLQLRMVANLSSVNVQTASQCKMSHQAQDKAMREMAASDLSNSFFANSNTDNEHLPTTHSPIIDLLHAKNHVFAEGLCH
jgi:hypothetical protein